MIVLQKGGQRHTNSVARRNLPKTPNKGHDGIGARYQQLAFDQVSEICFANLR